ncbi:MAG: methyltransferase domain-containing protein [Chloroflexi bacterium]|nr:methyltransferase domain-containing protein [Chloroflexota bacterium]
MGRGRYPARLKVAPPPPELVARYLHLWPGRELYLHPERFPLLSSPGLFGDTRPLELDIGCATGDLVLALARLHPTVNYVGVDVVGKPLWRAVERAAAAGLANVRFLQADARLVYRRIPDRALRAAYVHFPAPLLRNRQRNQLLISADLLVQMQRCLVPGGVLSVMTDHEALYGELMRLLPAAPGLRLVSPAAWSVTISELLKSHYHRRWEARGRQIWRAELVRASEP